MNKKAKETLDLINLGKLNKLVSEIEALFATEGLNIEEQRLLINSVSGRITAKFNKAASENLMQNMTAGGFLGSLAKKLTKSEE